MKCPACKMETPEEIGYCDFCKEPFRRKPPPPEPEPEAEKVALAPEVMAKVLEAKRASAASASGEPGGIPPEFAGLDAGERIPEIPPQARKLAWAFLAIVVLWTAVGIIYLMKHPTRGLPKVPRLPAPTADGSAPSEFQMPPPPLPDAPAF